MSRKPSNYRNPETARGVWDNAEEFQFNMIANHLNDIQLEAKSIPSNRPNIKPKCEAMCRKIDLEMSKCLSNTNNLPTQKISRNHSERFRR